MQFSVCRNISGALRKGLPLATVVNPKEFSGIDTKVVLAATARVKAYGVYRAHPKKFNEEDIVQGGFNYCSSEVFLPDRWRLINGGQCGQLRSENVLDAYLRKKDRLALVPKVLNQNDDVVAGSVVMSPAGIRTHLHLDPVTHDSKKHVSCGAWMYLVEGEKKFFFVHRHAVEQALENREFTIENLRKMNIQQLKRAFKGGGVTFLLTPYNLVFFKGFEYFHAVETGASAALGISGFYGYNPSFK